MTWLFQRNLRVADIPPEFLNRETLEFAAIYNIQGGVIPTRIFNKSSERNTFRDLLYRLWWRGKVKEVMSNLFDLLTLFVHPRLPEHTYKNHNKFAELPVRQAFRMNCWQQEFHFSRLVILTECEPARMFSGFQAVLK